MELFQEMAVFARVVECGGFSAAARQLNRTTSAVSRQVTRLEKHIGGRLLARTTRQVAVTELGRQVYQKCQQLVQTAREIDALAGRYGDAPRGLLRVSAPMAFGQLWLAPRVPGFLRAYPEITLKLDLADRYVDLVEEGVDLAIRIRREQDPGLAVRPLCAVRYVLVASRAYLDERGVPATPHDLTAHDCIFMGYGPYGEDWTLSRGGEHAKVRVPSRLSVNFSPAMLAMVRGGAGIGLMADFTALPALADGTLVQVLPDWELGDQYAPRHAVAAYLPTPYLPRKVRAFIDCLADDELPG